MESVTLTKTEEIELTQKDALNGQVNQAKIERLLLQLYHLKQQQTDISEQIKHKKEELRDHFINNDSIPVVTQSEDGTYLCIQEKDISKDVLDLDGLALELNIDKKEISTPWDFSMLTFKGKLTPKMISLHTHSEYKKDIKISNTKSNPLKKKNKKHKHAK